MNTVLFATMSYINGEDIFGDVAGIIETQEEDYWELVEEYHKGELSKGGSIKFIVGLLELEPDED